VPNHDHKLFDQLEERAPALVRRADTSRVFVALPNGEVVLPLAGALRLRVYNYRDGASGSERWAYMMNGNTQIGYPTAKEAGLEGLMKCRTILQQATKEIEKLCKERSL
jgi:hypothetical protein